MLVIQIYIDIRETVVGGSIGVDDIRGTRKEICDLKTGLGGRVWGSRIGLRDSREIHPGCKNVIYPHRYKYTMVLLLIIINL